jgi:putative Holliday junction resolvase
MRVLGVDFGPRNIGLAVSDETGFLARPLRTVRVERVADAPRAVAEAAAAAEVAAVVVGIPVGLEGEERRIEARRALRFAKALRALSGLPVHMEDESESSREARSLGPAGRRGAAEREHARAAAVVLQRWLDRRRASAAGPSLGEEA